MNLLDRKSVSTFCLCTQALIQFRKLNLSAKYLRYLPIVMLHPNFRFLTGVHIIFWCNLFVWNQNPEYVFDLELCLLNPYRNRNTGIFLERFFISGNAEISAFFCNAFNRDAGKQKFLWFFNTDSHEMFDIGNLCFLSDDPACTRIAASSPGNHILRTISRNSCLFHFQMC